MAVTARYKRYDERVYEFVREHKGHRFRRPNGAVIYEVIDYCNPPFARIPHVLMRPINGVSGTEQTMSLGEVTQMQCIDGWKPEWL